jgi:hypothetical protein
MKRLYRKWFMHNMLRIRNGKRIRLIRPFVGLAKAENISGIVHDCTLPIHVPGTGRG